MDHVGGCVEQSAVPAVDYLAGMVDEDEVRLVDEGEGHAERVHPETVWVNGVAERDVPGDAFVETVFAEDAEGGRETAFEVVAFFVGVVEFGRA